MNLYKAYSPEWFISNFRTSSSFMISMYATTASFPWLYFDLSRSHTTSHNLAFRGGYLTVKEIAAKTSNTGPRKSSGIADLSSPKEKRGPYGLAGSAELKLKLHRASRMLYIRLSGVSFSGPIACSASENRLCMDLQSAFLHPNKMDSKSTHSKSFLVAFRKCGASDVNSCPIFSIYRSVRAIWCVPASGKTPGWPDDWDKTGRQWCRYRPPGAA